MKKLYEAIVWGAVFIMTGLVLLVLYPIVGILNLIAKIKKV